MRAGRLAGLLLLLFGGLLAAEILLSVGVPALGVPDGLEQPANFRHVIAACRHPGPGRDLQVVAGIDGAEAVVGDAGPLGSVSQVAGMALSAIPRRGGAASELAYRLLQNT